MLVAGTAPAQSVAPQAHQTASDSAIRVRNVSIEQTDDGLVVAIASNGALVPAITKLDGPPRLVIDLAGAVNAVPRAHVKGTEGEIKSIRVSQYQANPPLTRVVVDLSEPRDYAWETVQNKLLIHLRPRDEDESEDAKKPGTSAPAFTTGAEPAITYAGAAPTASVRQVNQQASGPSSVTATEETTVLNLTRGGQIRVCPGTTISVTSSSDKRDVMVGMSTGSFETHYGLSNSADSVLTPDFRIMLPGPGQFELAISADSRGNTCVRSLAGNTASAVVSELMGDGTYQIKPNEQVVFHNGQIAKADHDVPIDCGCPAAQTPVLRTEAAPAPPPMDTASASPTQPPAGANPVLSEPVEPSGGVAVKMAVTAPEIAAVTAPPRNGVHMQVDAPLIFRGNEPLPAPTEEAQKLPVTSARGQSLALVPLPPPSSDSNGTPTKSHPGFFGRVKHFLSSVFG